MKKIPARALIFLPLLFSAVLITGCGSSRVIKNDDAVYTISSIHFTEGQPTEFFEALQDGLKAIPKGDDILISWALLTDNKGGGVWRGFGGGKGVADFKVTLQRNGKDISDNTKKMQMIGDGGKKSEKQREKISI